MDIATTEIGKPYVWGGRGPDEFDCSGLITWAYKQAIGKSSIFVVDGNPATDASINDLYYENTEIMECTDVDSGDIVFITDGTSVVTHGGLFIRWQSDTDFEFLHASAYYGEVVRDTWAVDEDIRGQKFVSFGRLKICEE